MLLALQTPGSPKRPHPSTLYFTVDPEIPSYLLLDIRLRGAPTPMSILAGISMGNTMMIDEKGSLGECQYAEK